MKRHLFTGLLLASMLLLAACGNAKAPDGSAESTAAPETAASQTSSEASGANDDKVAETDSSTDNTEEGTANMNGPIVEIEVQDYGTVTVQLDSDSAPITVENFVKLAEEGFYDGLTLHRIISGFMIQGGDPQGNGMGGSEQTIKGEFASNGVENPLKHTRGAISMARSQLPDSASSQFFIVHEDSLFLDGEYAAFGYVTDGMEVVDAICKDTPVQDSNGTVAPADQPTITAVRVIEK